MPVKPRSTSQATPTPSDHCLSPPELAARWGMSPKTLERWRCESIGPVYLRLPGRVRYRLSDIEAYERDVLRIGTDEAACKGETSK